MYLRSIYNLSRHLGKATDISGSGVVSSYCAKRRYATNNVDLDEDWVELSPLKNTNGYLDSQTRNNNNRSHERSPLKSYSPKYRDHRYHNNIKSKSSNFIDRPPQELIENDQKEQLADIQDWFKQNINVMSDSKVNEQKWRSRSKMQKFGFGIEGELVYGIHPISNALQFKRRSIHQLFVQQRTNRDLVTPAIDRVVSLAQDLDIPIKQVAHSVLRQMSDGRPHQGLILDASPLPELYLDVDKDCSIEHNVEKHPLWLVLFKVKDPMNLGAILRSAHYLSVDRVIRTTNDSCPLTPVVSKASSGAMESMSIYTLHCQLQELVKAQKRNGWKIVATSAPDNCDRPTIQVQDYSITQPTMLLIGNEGTGIPDSIHNQCDDILTIQSHTDDTIGVNSLNVSVATGIILHSLLTQRR